MSNVRMPTDINEQIPVKIEILDNIKNKIKDYSQSDLTRELGGVLLGSIIEENNKYTVNVTDYLIAKHTDAKISSVTFTAETWAQINDELEEKDPNLKIVGWFHTHPGFGIFLSNWDIFIQDNFFNLPWQIAYVVDPCHKSDGFFIWNENEILKIDESNFEDNNINETKSNEDNNIKETNIKEKKINIINKIFQKKFKYNKIIRVINITLIIAIILLILYIGYKHISINKFLEYIKEINNYL